LYDETMAREAPDGEWAKNDAEWASFCPECQPGRLSRHRFNDTRDERQVPLEQGKDHLLKSAADESAAGVAAGCPDAVK
jgi:hypothetical protein